jgi:multidrug efflux system outer membrane protein
MAAANEKVGIAEASFFLSITLTGSAGYASVEAGGLLDWGSRTWSLEPSISVPLLKGGWLTAGLEARKAEFDKALGEYRKRVLMAFSEVENSLSDIGLRREQSEAQQKLLEAARRAADISIQRYKEGLVSFLEVIDAERSRLQAERDAIRIRSEELMAATRLIKAIGGNW